MLKGVLKVVGLAAKFVRAHETALLLGATMITCVAASVDEDLEINRSLNRTIDRVQPGFIESMSMRDRAQWIVARLKSTGTYKGAKKWLLLGVAWHTIYLTAYCCTRPRVGFFAAEKMVIGERGAFGTLWEHIKFITLWPVYGVAWTRDYLHRPW